MNNRKDTTLQRALERLCSYSIWNSETIDQRQKNLTRLARRMWFPD